MFEMHLHISVLMWIRVCFGSKSHGHLFFHIMDQSENSCNGLLLDNITGRDNPGGSNVL